MAETWLDVLKLAIAPGITGFVGVGAVLVTQALHRKNEQSSRRVAQQREHLEMRVSALAEVASSILEADALGTLCVGHRLTSQDLSAKLPELIASGGGKDALGAQLIESYVRGLEDRSSSGQDLFLKLIMRCSAAVAAAERIGSLPKDLAVNDRIDLAELLLQWQYAHILEADRPGSREEVKEIINGARKVIAPACRQYRNRLIEELESL